MKPGDRVMLKTACKCCQGKNPDVFTYEATFVGVQDAYKYDLNLFNCELCHTTRAEKIEGSEKIPAMKKGKE